MGGRPFSGIGAQRAAFHMRIPFGMRRRRFCFLRGGKEVGLSTPYCAADLLRGCDRSFAHSAREQTVPFRRALPACAAPVRRLR